MTNVRGINSTYRSRRDSAKKRLLISDQEGVAARKLAELLYQRGFDTRTTYSASEAREIVEFWKPDVIIVDLTTALSLFRHFATKRHLRHPPVIVTSGKTSQQVIEQVRRAGASDYLEKPFSLEQLMEKIQALSIPREVVMDDTDPLVVKTQELHLLNIFLKQATTTDPHCLHNLMRMVSLRTGALRASVVHVANAKKGVVLASNDDSFIRGVTLDLVKYPEILSVMQDHKARFIHDWQSVEDFGSVKGPLSKTPYEAFAVFPLYSDGKFFGVMSLRLKRQQPHEANYVQKLGDLCSKIISLTLRVTAESVAA